MKGLILALFVAQILLILIFWRFLPPQLPLFYSRPWGKEQLTTPLGLFLLPAFSLMVIFINFLLAKFISQEEKLIAQILVTAAFLFNLLCLLTLIQIIRLVI